MRTGNVAPTPEGVDLSEPGPNGRKLLAYQAETESNARTYPRRIPVAVAEAAGSRITDVDGRVYIDFLGGAGTLALGHNHPELVEAVRDQLSRLTQGLDLPTPLRAEFVRRHLAMLPARMRPAFQIHCAALTGPDAVAPAFMPCQRAAGRGLVRRLQG